MGQNAPGMRHIQIDIAHPLRISPIFSTAEMTMRLRAIVAHAGHSGVQCLYCFARIFLSRILRFASLLGGAGKIGGTGFLAPVFRGSNPFAPTNCRITQGEVAATTSDNSAPLETPMIAIRIHSRLSGEPVACSRERFQWDMLQIGGQA